MDFVGHVGDVRLPSNVVDSVTYEYFYLALYSDAVS